MATDVKLALPALEEGKLIIYTAKELDKREAVPLRLEGMHISTPATYLAKRGPKIDDVVVLKNIRERKIAVKSASVPGEGEVGSLQNCVVGQLNVNPDLSNLKINSEGAKFRQYDAKAHIKKNRRFFHDRKQYDRILALLEDFSAKVESEVKKSKDNQGNEYSQFQKRVSMEFDTKFDIRIPLFDGFEPVVVNVELGYDMHSNGHVEFYFLSEDLNEIIDNEAERIIGEQIDKIAEMNYMILQ